MKKRIRIQGTLIFLALIASILLSKFVFIHWKREALDEFLDVVGIILVLLGFLFRITARGYKEEKSLQSKNLVKDGPYYLIRHPMYFGTFLIGTGIVFALFELWTLPLFLVVYLLIYIPQIKKEEDMLSKRFGQDYKDYCRTASKYFPKICSLSNIKNIISLKFSWLKKELVPLIMAIIVIIAIETWQDVESFGFKEFSKEPLEFLLIILAFLIIIILFRKKNDSSW